jgi:hypothetical protein
MADIILSTEDLTVFGGPASISVDVDFGATGTRGSRIYGVSADPRLATTTKPTDIKNYDLAMVVSPSEADYLTVYQKIGTTSDDWLAFASLVPNVYSLKATVDFTDGAAIGYVPISDLFVLTSYVPENFMVQVTLEELSPTTVKPVATGYSLSVQDVGAKKWLIINLQASELSAGVWSDVSGERVAHVFITSTSGILAEVSI